MAIDSTAKQIGRDVAARYRHLLDRDQTAPAFRLAEALTAAGVPVSRATMQAAIDGWAEIVADLPEAM